MIAMQFTIELDIRLSFLVQAALPQLVTDRETKTHRRGRSKRSYGHCRRRTEIPEAERVTATISACRAPELSRDQFSQGDPQPGVSDVVAVIQNPSAPRSPCRALTGKHATMVS